MMSLEAVAGGGNLKPHPRAQESASQSMRARVAVDAAAGGLVEVDVLARAPRGDGDAQGAGCRSPRGGSYV